MTERPRPFIDCLFHPGFIVQMTSLPSVGCGQQRSAHRCGFCAYRRHALRRPCYEARLYGCVCANYMESSSCSLHPNRFVCIACFLSMPPIAWQSVVQKPSAMRSCLPLYRNGLLCIFVYKFSEHLKLLSSGPCSGIHGCLGCSCSFRQHRPRC